MPGHDDAERARAFLRDQARAVAERLVELPYGVAVLDPSLPRVWYLNLVRVDEPAPEPDAGRVVDDAEAILGGAGLAHRQVLVAHEQTGARLEPALAAAGYEATVHVLMALAQPDRPARAITRVEELGVEAAQAFTAEVMRRDPVGARSEDDVTQVAATRDLLARHGARFFGVCEGGSVVASCDLYVRERTAQVESVETLEEHRGKGYGSAVVARAAAEARTAGCDLIFLVTEEEGPTALYARLGFEPRARSRQFLRKPA